MRLSEMNGHKFNAPQADELLDILKKNCSSWIAETSWIPVYRGSKMIGPYDDFVKINVRPHKQDPDVPEGIQLRFDYLLKHRNHAALLHNSIHVIGDAAEASQYGRVFVIFPVGNFTFSWSPVVKSLMGSLFRDGEQVSTVEKIINTYKKDDLKAAILSGNEILVKCDAYYKVDAHLWREISK